MRPSKPWETPKLTVLVRTIPEDGVLQVEVCKFVALEGPGQLAENNCEVVGVGQQVNCLGIRAS